MREGGQGVGMVVVALDVEDPEEHILGNEDSVVPVSVMGDGFMKEGGKDEDMWVEDVDLGEDVRKGDGVDKGVGGREEEVEADRESRTEEGTEVGLLT